MPRELSDKELHSNIGDVYELFIEGRNVAKLEDFEIKANGTLWYVADGKLYIVGGCFVLKQIK